jgi:hypothetical protein
MANLPLCGGAIAAVSLCWLIGAWSMQIKGLCVRALVSRPVPGHFEVAKITHQVSMTVRVSGTIPVACVLAVPPAAP